MNIRSNIFIHFLSADPLRAVGVLECSSFVPLITNIGKSDTHHCTQYFS